MSIGKRLRKIRLHYGPTQAVISNYEAGRRIPDVNFLKKLIDIFQVDMNLKKKMSENQKKI